MNNIAIITARGGSKRIPRKNIKLFLGRPIIEYSIKAAKDTGLFNEIMVSTDDNEIAQVAKKAGANVPFMRSAATSDDFSTTADVLEEVLIVYGKRNVRFDHTCCIYPTAPMITPAKIEQAYALLIKNSYDSVLPLVRYSTSVLRSLQIKDGKMIMAFPEYEKRRSQDLPVFYYDPGQFYWLNTAVFLSDKKIYTGNTGVLEIDEMEVHDIDTEADWRLAELKYNLLHGQA